MIKKIYIWDDLSLISKDQNQEKIDKKLKLLKEIVDKSQCKLEVLKRDIIAPFKNKVNKLNNIVTIGTRPQKFLTNGHEKLSILAKRKIQSSGFANKCEIIVDDKIYQLSNINIIEDICVTGTTMCKVLSELQNKIENINIYFLMAYNETIKQIKENYNNVNIFCENILYESPIDESTCIFLSDLLFEKLGEVTYVQHIKNINLFGKYTNDFCNEVNSMREEIGK